MWPFGRNKKKVAPALFKSRPPRVRINPLIHAAFERHTPEPRSELLLLNISTTGVALTSERKEDRAALGARVSGNLRLGKESAIPVVMDVVRTQGTTTGCQFIAPSVELKRSIAAYFELEIGAGELRAVPGANLNPEPDGTPLWYTGENNCEIYLVTSGAQIVRFYLSFFGNYLEGGSDKPVRLGKIEEDPISDKPGHKGSTMIRTERVWDQELITGALRLIHQASKLDPAHHQKLVEFINSAAVSK